MQERIRYLTEGERAFTRSLYEECFPEDSESFVDYYYQEKTRDNAVVVMEDMAAGSGGSVEALEYSARSGSVEALEYGAGSRGGRLQVMMHLNPFVFRFGRERCTLNYIVAVATAPEARNRGKMSRCMAWTLGKLAGKGQPFTFLIPADPGIYRSSGFAFVPGSGAEGGCASAGEAGMEGGRLTAGEAGVESGRLTAGEAGVESGRLTAREIREEELPAAAEFANRLLAAHYQAFPLWDPRYGKRLGKELRAQEGGLLAAADEKGILKGIAAYGREEDRGEIQHFLSEREDCGSVEEAVKGYLYGKGIREVSEAKMSFMVRILDLPRLMELLGGAHTRDFRLRVRLRDSILEENNGCFELYCREGIGGMREILPKEAEAEMDIAVLAEYLFGKIRMYIREWV